MNLFNEFAKDLRVILDDLAAGGDLPAGLDISKVTVEPPRESSHGDLSTNAALVLSKQAGRKPRDIAELLAARLRALPDVTSVDIAGPDSSICACPTTRGASASATSWWRASPMATAASAPVSP